jgi:hypothetical protein
MPILTYFRQKSGRGSTLPSPTFCSDLTAITDHPRGRGSPAGRWSAIWHDASQDPNQFPFLGHVECRGRRVLSLASSLTLTAGMAPFWANSQNRSTLLHTKQIPGEVSLDLINERSKTERTLVLQLNAVSLYIKIFFFHAH